MDRMFESRGSRLNSPNHTYEVENHENLHHQGKKFSRGGLITAAIPGDTAAIPDVQQQMTHTPQLGCFFSYPSLLRSALAGRPAASSW